MACPDCAFPGRVFTTNRLATTVKASLLVETIQCVGSGWTVPCVTEAHPSGTLTFTSYVASESSRSGYHWLSLLVHALRADVAGCLAGVTKRR